MSTDPLSSLFAEVERRASEPLLLEGPLYIYGAGKVGRDVCRVLRQSGREVAGFLDRKAAPGAAWEGTPILAPDDAALTPAQRKGARVILAVLNPEADARAIREMLLALGYGAVVSLVALHAAFPRELGDRFWLGPRETYLEQREQIAAALALYSDEASRALFLALLRWRLLDDDSALPAPSPQDQYFPAGLPAWPSPLRFVDCGAYDGDTLRQIAQRGLAVEAVAAFEPDPGNFRKLADSLRAHPLGGATTSLFPCGAGATMQTLRFAAVGGSDSRAADDGDTTVVCVPLDDALAGFRPNFIKMDIEGAELDALLGARRIISAQRPGLAVCLYHQADHLWKLPLLAAEMLPQARHFLRLHAFSGFELVQYVMP